MQTMKSFESEKAITDFLNTSRMHTRFHYRYGLSKPPDMYEVTKKLNDYIYNDDPLFDHPAIDKFTLNEGLLWDVSPCEGNPEKPNTKPAVEYVVCRIKQLIPEYLADKKLTGSYDLESLKRCVGIVRKMYPKKEYPIFSIPNPNKLTKSTEKCKYGDQDTYICYTTILVIDNVPINYEEALYYLKAYRDIICLTYYELGNLKVKKLLSEVLPDLITTYNLYKL